jgi:hypothetical protein
MASGPFLTLRKQHTNRERLLQLTAGPLVPRGRAVPSWIWPVLKKGLSAAPHERFATMRLLLDALDPKQRHTQSRKRLLQGATVTALAALVGAVGYVALLRPEHLCVADAQHRADAAWSPQRESLAKHAFEALRLPYTADVVVRLSAVLQQYRRTLGRGCDCALSQHLASSCPTGEHTHRTRSLLRHALARALGAHFAAARS